MEIKTLLILRERFLRLGFSGKAFDNISTNDLNKIESLIIELEVYNG